MLDVLMLVSLSNILSKILMQIRGLKFWHGQEILAG